MRRVGILLLVALAAAACQTGEHEACDPPRRSAAHLVDPLAGATQWTITVPWVIGEAMVVESTLIVAGVQDDYTLSGYDVATGNPLWTEPFGDDGVRLVASESQRVALQARDDILVVDRDGTLVEIDMDGSIGWSGDFGGRTPVRRYAVTEDGRPVDPFTVPPQPHGTLFETFDELPSVHGEVVVYRSDTAIGVTEPDGREWTNDEIPLDDEFSEIRDIRLGDESVLVIVSSNIGPNRRLVVIDRHSGEIRWTLDGIRGADLAGDRIIYDRRISGNAGDGDPTREVFLVEPEDPALVVWSALSFDPLGGFFGHFNGENLFLGPNGIHAVGSDGPTEPMTGASVERSEGASVVSANDWVAVISEQGAIHVWTGTSATLDFADPAQQLLEVDDKLVVLSGTPMIGCA